MRFPPLHSRNGLFVAFMGLPGSGKSTIARQLVGRFGHATLFAEPDESSWPDAVMRRQDFGFFSALTWFRAMRVPQLWAADALRRAGRTAIVDSYYDKLLAQYICHKDMQWLIPKHDPFFPVAKEMARLDAAQLPNADVVVFLRVTVETWRQFLRQRDRLMDREDAFLRSFDSQAAFLRAAQAFSVAQGSELLVVDQKPPLPDFACDVIHERLLDLLRD